MKKEIHERAKNISEQDKINTMKRIITILIVTLLGQSMYAKDFNVRGPQGGLAMALTLPDGFDAETDSCELVILMHGLFASMDFIPMPRIAKQLAKAGIASIRFDFGGHWDSEGELVKMTIEKELADAMAMWDYACSLPYVSKIGLLGHSQGGVVASMMAGHLARRESVDKPLYGLVLLAPASGLKNACRGGGLFDAKFDPADPPEYVRCFKVMKLGREYLLNTQQLDIYGTAEAYKGPVRIIHGKEDHMVPMWCSEDYKKLYGDAAELIVLEGENHLISKKTKRVAELVAEFFTRQ